MIIDVKMPDGSIEKADYRSHGVCKFCGEKILFGKIHKTGKFITLNPEKEYRDRGQISYYQNHIETCQKKTCTFNNVRID